MCFFACVSIFLGTDEKKINYLPLGRKSHFFVITFMRAKSFPAGQFLRNFLVIKFTYKSQK